MTQQHFAASWLQSLSTKLDALAEWSWLADKTGSIHKNLFREFFSANFQKILALVSEQKKTEFLKRIEKNLYKFEDRTQQFPLGCLCALLQHGKESAVTQDKIAAWVNFLVGRLQTAHADDAYREVVAECLSEPFLKFLPVMEEAVRERLADGLGEHIGSLDEQVQKQVLENISAVPERIEKVMSSCTADLNAWLLSAPRFPATPRALRDALGQTENPLVRFFTSVKDASKKEAFLVGVALTLQSLRTRFRWMCFVEPDLETLGQGLQRRLFFVEGQGPVMEMWLSARLKKYNTEVAGRCASLFGEPTLLEELKFRLRRLFPEQPNADLNEGWLPLDGPNPISVALLQWLAERGQGFFCPEHTVGRDTIIMVLHRFGRSFEVDPTGSRCRLGPGESAAAAAAAAAAATADSAAAAAATASLSVPPPPTAAAPGASAAGQLVLYGSASAGAPPPPPLGVPPPPLGVPPPPAAVAALPATGGGAAAAAAGAGRGEVDNLVDLLFTEALEGAPAEVRAKVMKMGHGVYRIGEKEVTLHTTNGNLYVYRIGQLIRHEPIKNFLQGEGIIQAPPAPPPALPALPAGGGSAATAPAGGPAGGGAASSCSTALVPAAATASASGGGGVDNSAVAWIAHQSKQISAGVTTTTSGSQAALPTPFGQSRQEASKTDPQALMSKRVEAATIAMNASKQMVRRLINFNDEKLLKKIVAKGLKHDKQWQAAYEDYCNNSRLIDMDPKKQDINFVAAFVEVHFASFISQEWAKNLIDDKKKESKDKKDKKEKKDKDKKKRDKKRKASESSSSDEAARAASAATAGPGGQLALANAPHAGGLSCSAGSAGLCGSRSSGGSGGGCSATSPLAALAGAALGPPPGSGGGLDMQQRAPMGHMPPPGMPLYGMGMPPGMGHMMGPMGMPMYGGMVGEPGMPPGMGMMVGEDDHRSRKKMKSDKAEKADKPKKAEKSGKGKR